MTKEKKLLQTKPKFSGASIIGYVCVLMNKC